MTAMETRTTDRPPRGRRGLQGLIGAVVVVGLVAAVWWWSEREPVSGEEQLGEVVEVALPAGIALPGEPTPDEPILPLFVDACHTVALAADAGSLAPLVADPAVGDGLGRTDCRFGAPDLDVVVTIGPADFEARVDELVARAPEFLPPEPVRIDGTDGVFLWEGEVGTLAIAGHDHDLTIVVTSPSLARDEALDLATRIATFSFSAG